MEKSCKGICSECDILCSISIQKHNLLLDDVLGKIQTLEKENEQLKKDNFALSAGCCEYLIGDERGHDTCKFREENKLLVDKLENIDSIICEFVVDDINVDLKDFTKEELISIVENSSVKSADIIAKIRGLT